MLNSVDISFRDCQWFAVKMQLLEKAIEKQGQLGREMLVETYKKDLDELKHKFEQTYGASVLVEADFLPDA